MKRRYVLWRIGVVLGGLLAIGWTVHEIGGGDIRHGIEQVFFVLGRSSLHGFLALLGLYFSSYLLDALAWRMLLPTGSKVSYGALLRASIAGGAINTFTPSGNLGEPVKVVLLRRQGDPRSLASTLLVWNALYIAANAALVVCCAVPILLVLNPTPVLMGLYLGGAMTTVAPVLILWSAIRLKAVSRILQRIERRYPASRIGRIRSFADDIEEAFQEQVRFGTRSLVPALILLFISRVVSNFMTIGIAWTLGIDMSFWAVAYVQLLNQAVNVVFGFVPGRLGVAEGYTEMSIRALGGLRGEGLGIAVVSRCIQAVAVLVGTTIVYRNIRSDRTSNERVG